MDKRYQIFISSTFADLKDERSKVMETILSLDCFPAGMELFPAMNEEQFEYIKKIIDDSDFYLLIIGGRYGTLYKKDGDSYTEMEFDYAISKNIPVIVFDHRDYTSLPANKTDQDDKKRKKLDAFKKKAANGRMINFWKNADDLSAKVAKSLAKVLRDNPDGGWVKASSVAYNTSSDEIEKLQKELSKYKREHEKNAELKKSLEESQKQVQQLQQQIEDIRKDSSVNVDETNSSAMWKADNQDFWSKKYSIPVTVYFTYDLSGRDFKASVEYTLKGWFSLIGKIIKNNDNEIYRSRLNEELGKSILEHSYYSNYFNKVAQGLVPEKKTSKLFRAIYVTDIVIKTIEINVKMILDLLSENEYLINRYSYFKLTDKGEAYLINNCLNYDLSNEH